MNFPVLSVHARRIIDDVDRRIINSSTATMSDSAKACMADARRCLQKALDAADMKYLAYALERTDDAIDYATFVFYTDPLRVVLRRLKTTVRQKAGI